MKPLSLDIRESKLLLLSLFFILFPQSILADENSGMYSENRIVADLFIPTLGKNFDSQAFIFRESKESLFGFDCSVTNAHTTMGSVFKVDGESYLCGLRYEARISPRFRIQGSLTGVNTGGGIFDSAISNWHQAFSLPNGSRGRSDENQYDVEGINEDGGRFLLEKEEFGLLDPQIYASYLLNEGEGKHKFFLNSALSMPIHGSQFGSKTPNLLLGLSYARNLSNSILNAGMDITIRTDLSDLGIDYKPLSLGANIGWTYFLTDSLAFVSSSFMQTSTIDNISNFPAGVWYVDLGLRTDIIFNVPLEIVIRENFYHSNSTADVSLLLKVLKF
jgi:hypothetical protein